MKTILFSTTCVCAALAWTAASAQSPNAPAGQTQRPSTDAATTASQPNSETSDQPAANAGVEEIVVTAQRRSERLQNVPVAVSAATAARLEAVGVTSTQDLSLVTPGLILPQAAGYAQPHIRGVGSSTNGPGLEAPVATYIDGVYLASAPNSLLTLNNVDQIEVLKGPQGTLFGRNSTGGLIQIVTKDPAHDPSGAISVGYANYDDFTSDLYVTSGVTDTLAGDLALRYEQQGSAWGTNLGTGHPIGQLDHDFAGRTKWLFEPTDDTEVRLALDYENRVSSQDVQHLDPQYPGTFNNRFFGGPFPMGGRYDINNNFDPVNKLEAGGVSLQIKQDFGDVVAQSTTAYRRSRYGFSLDTDLTPADILQIYGVATDAQLSQEFQLSSQGEGPLKWTTGLFYYEANDRWGPLDVNFGPSVISPVPGVPVTIASHDKEQTNSVAGYAQATYEVLTDTNLTLGGRYTYEKKAVSGVSKFEIGGVAVQTTPIPQPGLAIPDSIDFEKFNYRVALDHKFGPDILGYVSYNTGFKSGGYNLAVPSNPPYSPETIGAVEIGLKSELFDRRLKLNIAGYHYDYNNIQVGRYFGGNESIYNGAGAEIKGADLDAEVVLADGLILNGGIAYNDARFTSFPLADFVVPVNGCVPAPGGFCSGSAAGHRLPFAPTTTFNFSADYETEVSIGTLAFDVTYFHTSRFYAAPDNVGYQSAYDLVDVSASWTDLTGHYSVRLWAKNLGNTNYATSLLEADQGLVESLGAPRTYGITAGYKF